MSSKITLFKKYNIIVFKIHEQQIIIIGRQTQFIANIINIDQVYIKISMIDLL